MYTEGVMYVCMCFFKCVYVCIHVCVLCLCMYVSSVYMYDIMYILKYQEEVGYIDVFLYVCVLEHKVLWLV